VSLGLLSDSRTQDWGATSFISRNKGTRMRERKRKKNVYGSFQTSVMAQPLVGRNAEPSRATVSST
jgi:hypothetical protein